MNQIITFLSLILLCLISCDEKRTTPTNDAMKTVSDTLDFISGYSAVNGLKMYYEIYGQGKPLVLIHGGGSTIQSTFGKVIPFLAKHRKVIAVELQAHGRTGDRNSDLSFEQDADDVAQLLQNLKIDKADFFGFSNGGTTTLQVAIRHPEIVRKIVLGSALFKRNGVAEQFWGYMEQASLENMPVQLKEAYGKVSANPKGLQVMFARDKKRMIEFQDIADDKIRSIQVPALIITGDHDVITPEHALEMHRLITTSELAIIPGVHGEYIGEITTLKSDFKKEDLVVPMIERFLDKQ